jgi:hypothetical protein
LQASTLVVSRRHGRHFVFFHVEAHLKLVQHVVLELARTVNGETQFRFQGYYTRKI